MAITKRSMILCVVVLPSYIFRLNTRYGNFIFRVGEIHRVEEIYYSRSPLSKSSRGLVNVELFSVIMSGRIHRRGDI